VTTRSKNLGGAQFQHLDAGFLAPPHDRELVVRLAGRDPEPGLEHLLSHLAGHTLALELAGAFLGTYGGESAQSYHAALQQKGEAIETEVRDRVAYDATVAEAFRAIWSRMDDPLREAWRIAACFAPEPASRQLATAVGLTPEALRALEEFHVIRCAPDGRWSMHRLTQAFGRTAGPPDELRGAELRFVQGCAAYFRGVTRYNWVELLLPDRVHFDAALVLGAEVLPEHSDLLTQLRFGTAHGLDALGDFEGAQLIWRQAASSCQAQIASESHPPAECAVLYRQLADALILLAEREQDTSTAEESVHAYREALRNLDRAEEPLVWGGAQSALAYALLRLGADRRDPALLWDSVNAQRAALEELTRERDVLAWAECQRHLATALLTLGQVTNTDAYFDEAEATVRAILEECPRETFPVTWTFAQHRHSLVLMAIGERTGDAKRLDEALRGFRTLLESWTYERLPREWLMTQSNVASALLHLGRATGSVERLREALGTLRLVLTTSASGPRSDSWADAHDLLGTVLEALAAKQDAVPHLRDALDAYRTALEARDRDRFAHRWAETQYRIARVLGQLSNARAPEVRRDEILEALDRAREVWRSTGFRKGLDAVERELAKLAPPDPTHGST
jgi:tetratricopeptide (TPR) repeat protein